ncbi:LLM class F420-dependent oxidoreductase [Actinomadura fibrosa]|uniref:LLM class F420-dependent oxidoreductase n=1 Tax=Actinomadura fibrosa TaxID=111802 RepID=A0ABW2XUC3_9ACTN|nr:LLM class F420-dependent oxidoreductase [Actinomadura fibrosa]
MRLGVNLGYLRPGRRPEDVLRVAAEADRLGYATGWVGEATGSDAVSLLAWLAAGTARLDLGAGVMQIPARSPALTAMTAATLDTLSGGRFRLGLGVSGGQVSEGWHGARFTDPLGRTREYVEIVRKALARGPVEYAGRHHTLPLPGGPGRPLRLGIRPPRERIPIYLAALGPRNLELTGEIADGWLALFLDPARAAEPLASIRDGRRRAGLGMDGFDVAATVPLAIGGDADDGGRRVRDFAALYLGGMGTRGQNFYNRLAARMGYADEARRVQDLYLAGRTRAAAQAVPQGFLDRTALLGPPGRISARLREYAAAGVTTLCAMPMTGTAEGDAAALRALADAHASAGLSPPGNRSASPARAPAGPA